MQCLSEWSWIFSEGVGKAYGRKISSVDTFKSAAPFFYFTDVKEHLFKKGYSETLGPFKDAMKIRHPAFYNIDFNPKKAWGSDWTPPPYKEHYSKGWTTTDDKDIIVISNKYNEEWNSPPVNYLSLDFISKFISLFSDKYQIYYIRYNGEGWNKKDSIQNQNGYYDDVFTPEFNDYCCTIWGDVVTVYDFMEKYNIGFNEAQLIIMSQAKHIVSVNGGNAVLSSYFGEDVMIYGNDNCISTDRGVWKTGSWLKELSGANIIGHLNEEELLRDCEKRWL